MTMADDMDVPIALRRTRRSTSLLNATDTVSEVKQSQPAAVTTPRKSHGRQKTKNRVRFSDPGAPANADTDVDSLPTSTTGLTPMTQRASLTARKPHRRHSTPALRTSGHGMGPDPDSPSKPYSGEITFLPLRQVLDGRVKRRIRRNGLSEEMNTIHTEKRQRAAAAKAELEQLHQALAEKDAEIQRLQQLSQHQHIDRQLAGKILQDGNDDTMLQDNDCILQLEREVGDLRQQLSIRRPECMMEDTSPLATPEAERTCNWTMAARDPFASTINDDMNETNGASFFLMSPAADVAMMDDDAFGESTLADLQCSTPNRPAYKKRQTSASDSFHNSIGGGSFPTPPATSPATLTPTTPSGRFITSMLSPVGSSPLPKITHAAVQTILPDHEKQELQIKLDSMHCEMAKLTTSLETYRSLLARLDTQLPLADARQLEGVLVTKTNNEDISAIEARVALVLQTLSDKTAALADLSSGLSSLGFPGGDASDIVISLAAAFRTARLELEYLTPGEITLPLAAPGAQVLDFLLEKLRTFAHQVRESDEQIDEYHEIERSLRQQLGARVDTMDQLAHDVTSKEAQIVELEAAVAAENAKYSTSLAERDERIAELEIGLDRLKGAMASYAHDIAELEELVQRLEKSLVEKDAALVQSKAAAVSMETKLAAAVEKADLLRAEVVSEAYKASEAEKALAEEKKIATECAAEVAIVADEAARSVQQDQKSHQEQLQKKHQQEKLQQKRRHDVALSALNQAHGRALALRDARVSELRREIEQINASLRTAHDAARQLRLDNASLSTRLDAEQHRAQDAATTLQAELARVGQMGHDLLLSSSPQSLSLLSKNSRSAEISPRQTGTAPKPATGRKLLSLGRRRSGNSAHANTATAEARTIGNTCGNLNESFSSDGSSGNTASGRPRLGLFFQSAKRRSSGNIEDQADEGNNCKSGAESSSAEASNKMARKRRRRYDSGLGFLDEEEVDEPSVL